MNTSEQIELESQGYRKVYDYSQYAHDNHVNVIPEASFKSLVSDTFKTIADVLRSTYGPYGSSVIISSNGETTTTKDGYNVFNAMQFNHAYKQMVYNAIQKIITRVNRNVGDGTTSCILLAEKIFNKLTEIIETPDQKRKALMNLTIIEENLQKYENIANDIERGFVKKLDKNSLFNLIRLSSNYDEKLTEVIYHALNPQYDEKGNIISIRNVIPTSEIVQDIGSSTKYTTDFIPGDYRMRVDMSIDDISRLATPTKLKCIIYDHAFNSTDWINFMKKYNNEPTLILARTFSRKFIGDDLMQYFKRLETEKKYHQGDGVNNIYLCWVKGEFIQHEIQDIANLLNIPARDIHATTVDHDELPVVNVQICKSNCLVFYDMPRNNIEKYCNHLTEEFQKENSHSYVKQKEYQSRMKAIKMESNDTFLTVKCGTSLESKLLEDKIDDCISIVNSAYSTGIVPNLLRYAYDRVMFTHEPKRLFDSFEYKIISAISSAIKDLFYDIWDSKYDNSNLYPDEDVDIHYSDEEYTSFDIIHCDHTDPSNYPTSAQYDLEVVAASLSIVKYLLDGRALIFDAQILPQVNDDGHYSIQ